MSFHEFDSWIVKSFPQKTEEETQKTGSATKNANLVQVKVENDTVACRGNEEDHDGQTAKLTDQATNKFHTNHRHVICQDCLPASNKIET